MKKKNRIFLGLVLTCLAVNVAYAATRPIVSNQRSQRQIFFRATDSSGQNNSAISVGDAELNIADAATGSYTVTILKPFYRAPIVMCSDAATDSTRTTCDVGTTNTDNFALRCYSVAAPTTLVDFSVMNCLINGWDSAEGAL